MQALSHSPFLQALGYAIANSLWQMALLWIVTVLLNGVFRFSSAVRYRIALLAQVAGFLWFIFTLQFYYHECAEAMAIAASSSLDISSDTLLLAPAAPGFHARLLACIVYMERMLPYLSVAYLCLLLFLFVRWMQQYRHTQLIRSSGLEKIDVEWRLFTTKIAERLGIKTKVRIYLSSLVNSPLTIGFLKPMVLVPLASINLLTTEQMEAVILHELAHIKRADYLVNLLQCLIEIALFFNPFSQLLSKIVRKERENCCDDWVLQFQYDASMYAEALLRIAYLPASPAMAMRAGGAVKGDLLSRVKRMLNQKEKQFPYKQQLLALVLMTGILSSIAWFQPMQNTGTTVAAGTPPVKAVVMEPITAKVDNPLFSPVFFLTKPLQEEVSKAAQNATRQLASSARIVEQVQSSLARVSPAIMENLPVEWHNSGFDANTWKTLSGNLAQELNNIDIEKIQHDVLKGFDTATVNRSFKQALLQLQQAQQQANEEWSQAQVQAKLAQEKLAMAKDKMALLLQPNSRIDATPPALHMDAFKFQLQNKLDASIKLALEAAQQKMEQLHLSVRKLQLDTLRLWQQRLKAKMELQQQQNEEAAGNNNEDAWSFTRPMFTDNGSGTHFVFQTGEENHQPDAPGQPTIVQAQPAAAVPALQPVTLATYQYKNVQVVIVRGHKSMRANCKHDRDKEAPLRIRRVKTSPNGNIDLSIEVNEEE